MIAKTTKGSRRPAKKPAGSVKEHAELAELAESIGCFSEPQFQKLTDTELSTLDAWRKRGQGPAYVRLGCRLFYPKEAVREFIAQRMRRRDTPAAGGTL